MTTTRNCFTPGVILGRRRRSDTPARYRREDQQAELDHPAEGDRHRQPEGGVGAALREEDQRQHHAEVEQRGRKGGSGEARQAVEDAGPQRHQADQDQVGKGDPREVGRKLQLLARIARNGGDEGRHDELEDEGEDHQRREEDRKHFFGEFLGFGLAILALQPLGIEGNEAGRERPFAEQAAEGVGETEGDEKGVRCCRRAHDPAHQHLAREAEDAADQGQPADGAGGLEEIHPAPAPPNGSSPSPGSGRAVTERWARPAAGRRLAPARLRPG